MAEQAQYEELARQLSAIGAVKRDLGRILPHDCPAGSAAVLTLLGRYGEMRMSRLAELLAVDMSVTSRHVAHVADRGWIERSPDPADKRSRILRLTPAGRDTARRSLRALPRNSLADRLSDWSDDEVGPAHPPDGPAARRASATAAPPTRTRPPAGAPGRHHAAS